MTYEVWKGGRRVYPPAPTNPRDAVGAVLADRDALAQAIHATGVTGCSPRSKHGFAYHWKEADAILAWASGIDQ